MKPLKTGQKLKSKNFKTMDFIITKEQVLELAAKSISTELYLKANFKEAFKKKIEIGKWYKREMDSVDANRIFFITSISHNDGAAFGYGIDENTVWFDFSDEKSPFCACNSVALETAKEATDKEVEEALIVEAKKIGYKKSVTCVFGDAKDKRQLETDCFFFENNTLYVKKKDLRNADIIFKDGKWSKIIPEEKTVITKEKALKIVAKKYKTTPENITIKD